MIVDDTRFVLWKFSVYYWLCMSVPRRVLMCLGSRGVDFVALVKSSLESGIKPIL